MLVDLGFLRHFIMLKMKYISIRTRTLLLALIVIGFSCSKKEQVEVDRTSISVIPQPVSMESTPGGFLITEKTKISVNGDPQVTKVVNRFAQKLRAASGYELPIIEGEADIRFELDNTLESTGRETYRLEVTDDIIALQGATPEALFRGIQTLRQLMPHEIEIEAVSETPLTVPGIRILDYPRFNFRGSMMDVSRHFFNVEEVKRYIDLLELYKINVLHLHLTDDQGWRIEIKSWPNLAQYGGQTEVGGGPGGYYTQEDYTEIVNYARDRFILIIPEIDMPGHTNAALASYPELNFENKAPELYTGTEVGFSSLQVHSDITYQMVDDVVRELAAITPGPYIHIGADEAHSTSKEDFIKFVNRAQEIVESHGKTTIGWEEVITSDIKEETIVQFWNTRGDVSGFTPKTKIIMSPASNVYLDMKYSDTTQLGLKWAGLTDLPDSYNWDPLTVVERTANSDILGVEAPIWAETTEDMDDVEYLVFPRLPGIAEIAWSPKDGRSWDEYKQRLANQQNRFEAMGINYFKSPAVPWKN